MLLLLSLTVYFLGGVFAWTFLEYILHRFLGHWKRGRNDFTREHLRHHREAHYFAPAYKKAVAAIIIVSLVSALLASVLGWHALAFSFGLGMMYLTYEVLHKRAHTHAPINAYGRWMRKHHFYHHFKDPKKNHGVTSPVWDIVFGTNVNPDEVLVLKKFSPPWLVDKKSGELLSEYAKDYKIK